MKIVEQTGGSTTDTRQFIWEGSRRHECRDAGATITNLYFGNGQRVSSTNYFYALDHLGSTREVSDSSGLIQVQYSYGPFGIPARIRGSFENSFLFAKYYAHIRSGLCLTLNRAYQSSMGRWISRDPLNEQDDKNLFGYVKNNPVLYTDPLGLYLVNENASNCLGHACSKGYVVPEPGKSISTTMDELGYNCDKVKSSKECCCKGGFMFFILKSNLDNPWTDNWPTGQFKTNEFHAVKRERDGRWTEVRGTWDPENRMDQYRGRPAPSPAKPDQQEYLKDHKYCCCPKKS